MSDFIEELPERMKTVDRYLLERNMDALTREAHNLKGISSNLGAMEMAECAGRLNKQSNEGYTHLIEGLFLELKKAEISLLRTANNFLASQDRTAA